MYVRSSLFRRSRTLASGLALICLAAGAARAAEPPSLDVNDLPELGEQPAITVALLAAPPSGRRLTVDMPVARLCADPRAKAVLDSDLPGLTTRPEFAFFKNMSLKHIKAMSGGRLTDADLAKVDAGLARLADEPEPVDK